MCDGQQLGDLQQRIAALEAEIVQRKELEVQYQVALNERERDITGLVIERNKVRADLAAARAALEKVEWVGDDDNCPWCGRWISHGHAPDCARQRALGLAKKPE